MSTTGRVAPRGLSFLLSSLLVTIALVGTAPAAAQTFPSTIIPHSGGSVPRWLFTLDKVVRLTTTTSGGQVIGHLAAYSLADLKLLWQVDQAIGDVDVDEGNDVYPDPEKDAWYIGSGPFSRLDLLTGKVDWSATCEQTGAVQSGSMRILSGGRLLVTGTEKCKVKSAYDALKKPVFTMLDANTGKVLWRHAAESYEYELALGYWARVAKYQGRSVPKDKRIQLESMLGWAASGDSSQADRLVIVGERLEAVKLSDGTSLYRTKDKVGILRGAYDRKFFFREGDEVKAFDGSTGAVAWTYDLKRKGATIYTVDDLRAEFHGVPADVSDIFISESSVVSRVSTETGKAMWTVKRAGMAWQGTLHALLTKDDDKVTAYDWTTAAKMWEAKIASRPRGYDSGEYIVFVDGGPIENNRPTPPFKITVAQGKDGRIVWTKKDVGGKKIDDFGFAVRGQVRLHAGETVENLNVADGSIISAPPRQEAGGGCAAVFSANGVRCRDWTGKLVWERKGSTFEPPEYQPSRHGLVVWTTSDGDVEVIGLADGSTKWKAKVTRAPHVQVNLLGTHMVVPDQKGQMLVKLVP